MRDLVQPRQGSIFIVNELRQIFIALLGSRRDCFVEDISLLKDLRVFRRPDFYKHCTPPE